MKPTLSRFSKKGLFLLFFLILSLPLFAEQSSRFNMYLKALVSAQKSENYESIEDFKIPKEDRMSVKESKRLDAMKFYILGRHYKSSGEWEAAKRCFLKSIISESKNPYRERYISYLSNLHLFHIFAKEGNSGSATAYLVDVLSITRSDLSQDLIPSFKKIYGEIIAVSTVEEILSMTQDIIAPFAVTQTSLSKFSFDSFQGKLFAVGGRGLFIFPYNKSCYIVWENRKFKVFLAEFFTDAITAQDYIERVETVLDLEKRDSFQLIPNELTEGNWGVRIGVFSSWRSAFDYCSLFTLALPSERE